MRNKAALLLAFFSLGAPAQLFGDENLNPPAQVTTTEHFDFAPGGVIRVKGSYGDLYVEGWDQAQVEVTVTKFLAYKRGSLLAEQSAQHLDAIRVTTERRSPTELEIYTNHKVPANAGVRLSYQIRVPRASHLVITHRGCNVSVADVTGEIQAACHRGDIMLWLPETGTYSINAKVKFGKVSSDFAGASASRFLVGQKFATVNRAPSQRIHLRMGFGGITIKPIFPESATKGK